jgi:hypothetical protein
MLVNRDRRSRDKAKKTRSLQVMIGTMSKGKEVTKLRHQWKIGKSSLTKKPEKTCKINRRSSIDNKLPTWEMRRLKMNKQKQTIHRQPELLPSIVPIWTLTLSHMSKIPRTLLQMRSSRESKNKLSNLKLKRKINHLQTFTGLKILSIHSHKLKWWMSSGKKNEIWTSKSSRSSSKWTKKRFTGSWEKAICQLALFHNKTKLTLLTNDKIWNKNHLVITKTCHHNLNRKIRINKKVNLQKAGLIKLKIWGNKHWTRVNKLRMISRRRCQAAQAKESQTKALLTRPLTLHPKQKTKL